MILSSGKVRLPFELERRKGETMFRLDLGKSDELDDMMADNKADASEKYTECDPSKKQLGTPLVFDKPHRLKPAVSNIVEKGQGGRLGV